MIREHWVGRGDGREGGRQHPEVPKRRLESGAVGGH